MELVDYIYDECHRQHVTNYGDFANAFFYVAGGDYEASAANLSSFVQGIAREVEPEVNLWRPFNERYDNLRTSHVGFMNGGSAAPVNEVRPRFDRWCEMVWETSIFDDQYDKGEATRIVVNTAIKQLLEIHPWVDGNGRTASILRNWMLGTLDDPQPLPEYHFS